MVSGSDEHGTPITVAAETQGVKPQDIVDKYHALNTKALLDLGCTWEPNIDPRGVEFGGSLFNRTSDPEHHKIVSENFQSLMDAGLFERKVMQQYYEIRENGGRFLPDRYVEGDCPSCGESGARGDQCDECGVTYEAHELKNPKSKYNIKMSESWMIGDQLSDIKAAKSAGIQQTILLMNDLDKDKIISNSNFLINSIKEIKKIIIN